MIKPIPLPNIMKLIFTTLTLIVTATYLAQGGEKMSDVEIKQKLLGYWSSPRHGYHIAPNGIIYMCPRKFATTTNHWAVKDGRFYWDNEPHTIVTLNDKKFVYREIGREGITFTLIRSTKEKVDPE